jgi:glycosyltransferase involved in cell wall biosynthesis
MKISIVTAAYNAASTIEDTLRSVAAQDWPDYEHLIVDGASTDRTMDVVARYDRPRLIARSEPDRGLYDAMNKGLGRAAGDIVGFLNADDFYARPDSLRLIAAAFERTGADCILGQTVVVARDDVTKVRRVYRGASFRPWMLRFGHMPPHPSFYARADVLRRVGGFDASYKISGDFDQMVKLFLRERVRFASVPETITGFRDGGVSTKDLGAKFRMNREILRSLGANGVRSSPALLWARYPIKALQYLGRPRDYPQGLAAVGVPSNR